jgi:hypothetical protein
VFVLLLLWCYADIYSGKHTFAASVWLVSHSSKLVSRARLCSDPGDITRAAVQLAFESAA